VVRAHFLTFNYLFSLQHTDIIVKIDEETDDESLISESTWYSAVDKKVAVRKINSILSKYINSDAISEVCISEDFLRKMKKRIKFLHLYGPAIFDEALIDPILTMHRDLLPRFEVSDTVNKMVRRYLCCSSYCHRLYLSRFLIAEFLSLRIIRLCMLQVVYHSLNSYPLYSYLFNPYPLSLLPLNPYPLDHYFI
jgi:hypothetical protein